MVCLILGRATGVFALWLAAAVSAFSSDFPSKAFVVLSSETRVDPGGGLVPQVCNAVSERVELRLYTEDEDEAVYIGEGAFRHTETRLGLAYEMDNLQPESCTKVQDVVNDGRMSIALTMRRNGSGEVQYTVGFALTEESEFSFGSVYSCKLDPDAPPLVFNHVSTYWSTNLLPLYDRHWSIDEGYHVEDFVFTGQDGDLSSFRSSIAEQQGPTFAKVTIDLDVETVKGSISVKPYVRGILLDKIPLTADFDLTCVFTIPGETIESITVKLNDVPIEATITNETMARARAPLPGPGWNVQFGGSNNRLAIDITGSRGTVLQTTAQIADVVPLPSWISVSDVDLEAEVLSSGVVQYRGFASKERESRIGLPVSSNPSSYSIAYPISHATVGVINGPSAVVPIGRIPLAVSSDGMVPGPLTVENGCEMTWTFGALGDVIPARQDAQITWMLTLQGGLGFRLVPHGAGRIRERVVSENVGILLEGATFAEGFYTNIDEVNAAIGQLTAQRGRPFPMNVVLAENSDIQLQTDAVMTSIAGESAVSWSTSFFNRTMIDGMITLRASGSGWHTAVATASNGMISHRNEGTFDAEYMLTVAGQTIDVLYEKRLDYGSPGLIVRPTREQDIKPFGLTQRVAELSTALDPHSSFSLTVNNDSVFVVWDEPRTSDVRDVYVATIEKAATEIRRVDVPDALHMLPSVVSSGGNVSLSLWSAERGAKSADEAWSNVQNSQMFGGRVNGPITARPHRNGAAGPAILVEMPEGISAVRRRYTTSLVGSETAPVSLEVTLLDGSSGDRTLVDGLQGLTEWSVSDGLNSVLTVAQEKNHMVVVRHSIHGEERLDSAVLIAAPRCVTVGTDEVFVWSSDGIARMRTINGAVVTIGAIPLDGLRKARVSEETLFVVADSLVLGINVRTGSVELLGTIPLRLHQGTAMYHNGSMLVVGVVENKLVYLNGLNMATSVGNDDPLTSARLQVSPNPAADRTVVRGTGGLVQVLDLSGRLVWQGESGSVSTAGWPQGSYIVKDAMGHGKAVMLRIQR